MYLKTFSYWEDNSHVYQTLFEPELMRWSPKTAILLSDDSSADEFVSSRFYPYGCEG